ERGGRAVVELVAVGRLDGYEVALGPDVQSHQIGDPVTQDVPHEVGRDVAVPDGVAGRQDVPEVVHQAGDLQFEIVGIGSAQHRRGLQAVVEQVVVGGRVDGHVELG